jgi:MoxR-like ATPase
MEDNVMTPMQSLLACYHVIKGGNTPYLIGSVGIGKSAVIGLLAQKLADDLKLKLVRDVINPNEDQFSFIDLRLSLLESVDLGGLPYLDADFAQKRAFLGNLPTGGKGLLLFDEFAQAHPQLQAIAGQLLYERRIGEYVLPDGWTICCSSNRQSDRAGSNKLPTHVIGRCSIIDFEHSVNDWMDWAIKNDIDPMIRGFINFQEDALLDWSPKVDTPQATPRTWARLSDTLRTGIPKDMRVDIFKMDIGERWAIEFANFLKLSEDVPNIAKIMKSPTKVAVPDDGGMCYATAVALVNTVCGAKKADLYQHFDSALTYLQRFHTPEFGVFYVRQTATARPELKETKTFADYKVENSELDVIS